MTTQWEKNMGKLVCNATPSSLISKNLLPRNPTMNIEEI
jgi:hypothetical protein